MTDTNSYYLDQYKSLRSEIASLESSLTRLEIVVVGAAAAYYAWLSGRDIHGPLWYVPVLVAILGYIRCISLYSQIGLRRRYLRELEIRLSDNDPCLPGYEHFFSAQTKKLSEALSSSAATAVIFWFIFIPATVLGPQLLDKKSLPNPESCNRAKYSEAVITTPVEKAREEAN